MSLILFSAIWSIGCGSDTTGTGGSGGGGTSGPGKQPPGPPEGAGPGDGTGVTFAVNQLFLGDTNASGSPDPEAWKDLGYDLDGDKSTKESTNLCKPAAGASPGSVYPDGNDGIDNAFGKILLPLITSIAPDASTSVNEAIADGDFTIMMNLSNLGSGANYVDIKAGLYAGVTLVDDMGNPLTPTFTPADMWPVAPELLVDPNCMTQPCESKVSFPTSYVNENTWVSGTPGTIDLSLGVAGFALTLKITNAVITMDMDSDHGGAKNGVIAGVIPVEPLVAELKKIAGSFDMSLCSGSTFESIADQIRQASDMLQNGALDSSKTCDAISVGLGFTAKPVSLGAVADPAPPAPDPCEAGGGGGAGGMGSGGDGGMGTGGSGGAGGGNG
ncbi:MAG: hypothetical protein KC731_35250 [Myxococcales bacterium]|nr:hypothetical protein [Myxococcales bacterium]